jgi:hypothetical protein
VPRLERADAAQLVSLAHRIPGEGACAQARDIRLIRDRAKALVNAGRVPQELLEPLMSAVGALGAERPLCLPAVTTPAPRTSPTTTAPGKHHGHGHGHDGDGDRGKKKK